MVILCSFIQRLKIWFLFVQHDKQYHLKVLRGITHKYFYQLIAAL